MAADGEVEKTFNNIVQVNRQIVSCNAVSGVKVWRSVATSTMLWRPLVHPRRSTAGRSGVDCAVCGRDKKARRNSRNAGCLKIEIRTVPSKDTNPSRACSYRRSYDVGAARAWRWSAISGRVLVDDRNSSTTTRRSALRRMDDLTR